MKLSVSGAREVKKVSKQDALYVLRYRGFKTKPGYFEILRRLKVQSSYHQIYKFPGNKTEEQALEQFTKAMAKIQ